MSEPAAGNSATDEQQEDKWVIDFQTTDKEGNPLGNPTHLEADTQKELLEKMKEANILMARSYHELKTGKSKPDLSKATQRKTSEYKPREWTAEEAFEVTNQVQSPTQLRKGIRKAVEDELGMSFEELRENRRIAQQVHQANIATAFVSAHRNEYHACPQNEKAMYDYMQENNLAYTIENLSTTFNYLKDSLIPIPQAAPVVSEEGNASPPAAKPRSASTSGLLPGETSGNRPAPGRTSGKQLTWAQVDAWSEQEWERNFRDPVIRAQVDALPPRNRR